jgi:hypothetical protein
LPHYDDYSGWRNKRILFDEHPFVSLSIVVLKITEGEKADVKIFALAHDSFPYWL